MENRRNKAQIAYRCPSCGYATVGLLGALTSVSDMLRLKCACGESSLDITRLPNGKISVSVPCVYCKDNHKYILSADILKRKELTKLSCPYANMDIAFLGDEEVIPKELDRTAEELSNVMKSFEAEELKDIQPQDVDESEVLPDPEVFDMINFLVRDLEDSGSIHCPCKNPDFDLRYIDDGIQVYCKNCGASHNFYAKTASVAEEYMSINELKLK